MITVLLMIAYRYYSWASYSLFHLEGDFGSLYILIPAAILELFILYKVVKQRWPRLSVQPNPIYKWIPASFQAAMGSGNRLL